MRNKIILVFFINILFLLSACTSQVQDNADNNNANNKDNNVNGNEESNSDLDWRNIELKDVNLGENYKISDFDDKPVLLESFAVWCPTCTKQQEEIKKLHDKIGDSVVSISLDTDPNEDEIKVKQHTTANGFDWKYSVSPVEMTKSLIDEFGNRIISAPSAPVIFICKGEAEFLDSGVKSSEELEYLVNSC